MKRVGKDGVITVEDGQGYEDELEVVSYKKKKYQKEQSFIS